MAENPVAPGEKSALKAGENLPIPIPVKETQEDMPQSATVSVPSIVDELASVAAASADATHQFRAEKIQPLPEAAIEIKNDIAVEGSIGGATGMPATGEAAHLLQSSDGRDNFELPQAGSAPNPPADESPVTAVAFPEQRIAEGRGIGLEIETLLEPQQTALNSEADEGEASIVNRIEADHVEVLNRSGSPEDVIQPMGGTAVELRPVDEGVTNQESRAASRPPEQVSSYPGLKPPRPAKQTRARSGDEPRVRKAVFSSVESEARLRIHLVFNNRGDAIRALTLLPDRRDEMPDELEVAGTQGTFFFSRFRDDAYESIRLPDAGAALLGGVEWRGKEAVNQSLRWVLRGREVYVLAPGPLIADLGGFVSVPRLLLNEENLVLARKTVRVDVVSALAAAGCDPTVIDDPTLGVPSDWLLFKGVKPSRALPMRDEQDVFNALCPLTDIEPHFEGGIKLARQTWLAGHPPEIRFTGAIDDSFRAKIDGKDAELTEHGYLAGGWDGEGAHELWYADKIARYTIRRCAEDWTAWDAYGFGAGALICGAQVLPASGGQRRQVRVPRQNSILIGAEPGQIFNTHPRPDLRLKDLVAMPPFDPVWSVPSNPAHLDKKIARVVTVGEIKPVVKIRTRGLGRTERGRIAAWCSAILDAGRKGLLIEGENTQAAPAWREYRVEAKRLKRSMR